MLSTDTGKVVSILERLEISEDLVTDNHEVDSADKIGSRYDSFGNTIHLDTSADFDESSSLYDDCESDTDYSGTSVR